MEIGLGEESGIIKLFVLIPVSGAIGLNSGDPLPRWILKSLHPVSKGTSHKSEENLNIGNYFRKCLAVVTY